MSVEGLLFHLQVEALRIGRELMGERDPRVRDCLERARVVIESTTTLAHLHAQQADQIEELTGVLARVEQELRRQRRPWWVRLLGIGG